MSIKLFFFVSLLFLPFYKNFSKDKSYSEKADKEIEVILNDEEDESIQRIEEGLEEIKIVKRKKVEKKVKKLVKKSRRKETPFKKERTSQKVSRNGLGERKLAKTKEIVQVKKEATHAPPQSWWSKLKKKAKKQYHLAKKFSKKIWQQYLEKK